MRAHFTCLIPEGIRFVDGFRSIYYFLLSFWRVFLFIHVDIYSQSPLLPTCQNFKLRKCNCGGFKGFSKFNRSIRRLIQMDTFLEYQQQMKVDIRSVHSVCDILKLGLVAIVSPFGFRGRSMLSYNFNSHWPTAHLLFNVSNWLSQHLRLCEMCKTWK